MSVENQASAYAKNLLNRLTEYNSDYESILKQLEELRQVCMSGIKQERVAVKTASIIEVTERYPQVAASCITGKLAVIAALQKLADSEVIEENQTIVINIVPLEDTLK